MYPSPDNEPELRRSDVSVGGLRTPVIEAGAATSNEAVVFVHGNPGSTSDWEGLMKGVAPHCRAIAMDMPGFGRADKPDDFDYTVSGYAAHLEALLQLLGISKAHLVLHDFGGPWGIAWAAAHPDRVASLTLVNTGIMPGYRWHYLARIWRTPLVGELFMATTTRAGFKLLLRHGNPRGLPAEYLDEMFDNFDRGTRRAVLKLYRQTSDLSRPVAAWVEALSSRRIPALVVWGARDPYLPVRIAEVQKQFFEVEQVLLLDDSGHWPMIDNATAVRQAVVPFIRSRTPDSDKRPVHI
jgi:pimeloyl-ACP methyl ester carboxylesterase